VQCTVLMNLWLLLHILGMNKFLYHCCAAVDGLTQKYRLLDYSADGVPFLLELDLELD
jgi:hypothetical protein